MSYALVDHAAWVQDKCRKMIKRWESRRHTIPRDIPLPPKTLNEFQRKVCDIIGMIGGGLYAPINWDRAIWEFGDGQTSFACVWMGEGLSTWDFNQLTLLVFLCHEARIKVTLMGAGKSLTRLAFHERAATYDNPKTHHPNLDEAVKWFKKHYLPKDHRIIYRDKMK